MLWLFWIKTNMTVKIVQCMKLGVIFELRTAFTKLCTGRIYDERGN